MPRKIAYATQQFHEERDSVNAYVVMETEDAARAAVQENGCVFEGRHLRIDVAGGDRKNDTKKSVFVGNLPLTISEETLWEFFATCGQISNVRVIRDKTTNLGKGFGYVAFTEKAALEMALQLAGTDCAGRPIRISKCTKEGFHKETQLFKQKRQELAEKTAEAAAKPASFGGAAKPASFGGAAKPASFGGAVKPAPSGAAASAQPHSRAAFKPTEQKTFADKPSDDKKPFGTGDRKSFGSDAKKPFGIGDKKPFAKSFGDKKPYERKPFGDRKPYDRSSFSEQKPFAKSFGDRKPFGNGDKKSFGNGDRKPFAKSFGERKPFTSGDRKPYERKSFASSKPAGERKPFAAGKPADRAPLGRKPTERSALSTGARTPFKIVKPTERGQRPAHPVKRRY